MSARRLLVTGAGGFVGRHVHAACGQGGAFEGWTFVGAPKGMDMRDADGVSRWVMESRPDDVLHLAAQSFVPRSFENPRETLDINLMGTLNLLLALKATKFSGKLVFVSSGDVYGLVPDDSLPVDEAWMPQPRSPYAVSKIAAEHLCLQWHRTERLHAMVARPFNHVGPGQDRRFALPAFAEQVVAIAAGRRPPVIEVGDIDTTRDFTDVRDVVAAYAAMFRDGRAGDTYVVGSGVERRLRDLLEAMCRLEGIAPEIRQDASRLRPAEQRRMAADASLLNRRTGWRPRIPMDATLSDILKDAKSKK